MQNIVLPSDCTHELYTATKNLSISLCVYRHIMYEFRFILKLIIFCSLSTIFSYSKQFAVAIHGHPQLSRRVARDLDAKLFESSLETVQLGLYTREIK